MIGWQGSAPSSTADHSAPIYMSPHRNRSRSTSNPHVNQAVRYHHDGHATGRAKAKLADRPSVDLLNGGGHQLLPPGPLTHRHTPSRRRQGYDKAAVRSTNDLEGAGLSTSKKDLPKSARKQNEQFRYYYQGSNTSHVKTKAYRYAQTRDHLWNHFKETSIPPTAPEAKKPVPDVVFGVSSERQVKEGKKRHWDKTHKFYHNNGRLIG
eukprot:g2426.t1